MLSALLAVIMTIGLIPMGSVTVKAETKNATLSNLGALGTVKIGSKSESGTWYQTEVEGTPVFCLDLGKACHAGDVYESSDATYSSNSKNEKKALEAKIGHWYSVTKKEATKAWVYAQALMWACEEGQTSEKNLTNVISQVRKNTGYYDSKSAAALYDEIFKISATVSCKIKIWKYGGSGEYRQVLMEIESGNQLEYKYEKINDTLVYRQRITIDKTDEDGNPVSQVPFEVTAQNYKELYDYKVNGWGDAETGDADGESVFSSVAETDSSGRITYKFNYQIQSKNYGYVKASDLESMTADDKKSVKDKMDDKNINYSSDLTKSGAEKLMKADLSAQMKKISNQYAVKEVGAGSDDMLVNSEYANGKIITIESAGSWTKVNGSWPETADKTYADYGKATKLGIVNKYKKATIVVNKKVENTSDNTAHGDTSVDGAVYRMYTDAACTNPVTTVYDSNGNVKAASDYTIKNGTLETDYIRTKDTVYIKEIKAPEGFFLDPTVHQIKVDGSQFDVEYKAKAVIEDSYESEKKGFFEVYKMSSDGSTGPADFEEGAEFQIYLRSNGSYDKCKDDEHSTLTIDKKGSAKTASALAYGTYVLHQTKTGAKDTEKIDDQIIEIGKDITSEGLNYKTYTYLYNNKPFEAYLKVVKKDGDTDKTVLKANTKYQIYKVNKDGSETKVVQQYSNGNKLVDIDTFVTDESGEIMTVKALKSGQYKIYEIDSASGLVIKDEFIDVTIGSGNPNYTSWTDSEGNSHALVTVNYVNKEAKGKLTLTKSGEVLKGFNHYVSNPENNKFVFKTDYLKGQKFTIYAAEDIVTQDNQGTNWFDKGEKVATVTTGNGAEFTKQCSDITTSTVDDETGAVTIYLPLGKYTVKEEETLYGYVIPDKNTWDIEFKWNDAKTDVVSNSTKDTDIHIVNQISEIMNYKENCEYLVVDVEQYADDADAIIDSIMKVKEAVNTKIIIYAVAFSPKSELLSGLYARGIRNYIFSEMLSDKKKDLTNCINGFYEQWGYESLGIYFEGEDEEQTEKLTKKEKVKTIGVAGAVRRMGTTTQALQIVKYLKFNGYKAAYFEMNNHGFVKAVREFYEDSQYDEMEGLTEYQNVDMYYKAERLKEVQDKDYEYIVYDYGVYSEHDFNKVSFLEKDIQIFVVGSKPDEFEKTYDLIKSNFYNDVFYVFNFTSDAEKKDIKELMEDKADKTFFADESKDPFTFGNSKIYSEMIPIENKSEEKKEKKSGFFRKRKK